MTTQNVLPVVIGVDIGGTNTDAVIIHNDDGGDDPKVVSEVKEQTTYDVIDGVRRAVLRCLLNAKEKGRLVKPIQVNIGTTHFVNAIVQHKELAKVAVIRLCGPVSTGNTPFCDFPTRLADTIRSSIHFVHGGLDIEGNEREALDENEIRNVARSLKVEGISNVCILGIFSSVNPAQELRAREIMLEAYPEATVSLSHEIGDIGLLERENATILNECLKPLCKKTLSEFKDAFEDVGVTCPFYFTQNDGTVISSTNVLKFPVLTFASGPTNSMRGAAFLSSKTEAVVIDIGGTTSDVGILKKGFPRESTTHVRVAGVKTNFRMPDVFSLGLGGGSYITEKRGSDGNLIDVQVGPLSAGFKLQREALVYSADDDPDNENRTLTATDIAVCAGLCDLGLKERVSHLDSDMVSMAKDKIHHMLEELVDRIKLTKSELPVIIVGGGSVLVDTKRPFKGASELIIPNHFGVSNAIGAALSKVSASIYSVVNLLNLVDTEQMDKAVNDATKIIDSSSSRDVEGAIEKARKPFLERARQEAIDSCCDQAKSQAVRIGARKDSIEILEKSDSFVSYIKGRGLNIKVKVVGHMEEQNITGDSNTPWSEPKRQDILSKKTPISGVKQSITSTGSNLSSAMLNNDSNLTPSPKDPVIDPVSGEWFLSDWDIECISIGSGIYGCGGGGSHYIAKLSALKYLRDGKKFRIIHPKRLLENADPKKDHVMVPAMIGSPTVLYEQGMAMAEMGEAIRCLCDVYRAGGFKDGELQNSEGVTIDKNEEGCRFIANYKPKYVEKEEEFNIVGVMSFEFAGINAIMPLLVAANMDLPLVDCDGMARAFPRLEMFVPYIYDTPPYPAAIVGSGNIAERSVLLCSPNASVSENYLRDVCIQNGCYANASFSLTKSEVLTRTVLHTVSSGWRLGNTVLRARLEKQSVTDAIVKQEDGEHIITGKVVDIRQETSGGFNKGHVTIEGNDDWSGKAVVIEFQNEFLIVFPLDQDGKRGVVKGCVPDLITVVDGDSGEPIHAEEIRYGMRVAVILIPSCDLLRHPKALQWVGPQAFHYDDVQFVPFKERKSAQPIPLP